MNFYYLIAAIGYVICILMLLVGIYYAPEESDLYGEELEDIRNKKKDFKQHY